MPPMYDPNDVRPMWEELVNVGIRPLTAADEVDDVLSKKTGTVLCVVNSVCGCAAGSARPGVRLSLQNETIPDELVTVFAGMDQEAVAKARSYLDPSHHSSPCIAVFKDGSPIAVLARHDIEQMNPLDVARNLAAVYNEHCGRKGPSVPKEVFESETPVDICGSQIGLFSGD